MTLKDRRTQEKQNMKKLISEAAVSIIIADGYDQLSMRKIADMIEYSPTTIYIYYKDKAQIVEDIAKRLYDTIVSNVRNALEAHGDAPIDERLEYSFQVFINSITANPEMGTAVIRSGTNAIFGPGDTEAPEENGVLLLQTLLSEGQRQFILRELDDNVSWMLITALLGFSMNAIENRLYLSADWPTLVGVYTKILMNGLLAKVQA